MSIQTDLRTIYKNLKLKQRQADSISKFTPDYFQGRSSGLSEVLESLEPMLKENGINVKEIVQELDVS